MKTKIFDGKKIAIKPLSQSDLKKVKKSQDFINSVVEEDTKILMNKKNSLKEEREWLGNTLKDMKKHRSTCLIAKYNNIIVGTTDIELGKWRENHVGNFGIIIRSGYRGIGLGEYLAKEVINLAKKELKPSPKILKLNVFTTNKPAIGLYKKLGFKKVARIPDQMQFKGKLVDEYIMLKYL